MTYLDIFSDAISYFTDIPKEFVEEFLIQYSEDDEEKAQLIDYIMQIEFPDSVGCMLLEGLKSKNLEDTIDFFNSSFKMIRQEEMRQSILN